MPMVCPRCNGSFEQRLLCPTCNVRLVYQEEGAGPSGTAGIFASQWRQTPWGRIIIGLVLAQGLYYGLRSFWTAMSLIAGDELQQLVMRVLLDQGSQALGLLIGGMLAGAGLRRGTLYGGIVGICNGLLTLVVSSMTQEPPKSVALYGLPLLHMAFGAAGAFVGSLVWRPLPVLGMSMPTPSSAGIHLPPRRRKASPLAGPISGWRVLGGIAVAVGGTMWAHLIFGLLIEASQGKMEPETKLQQQFITWEICFLAMFGGGLLAGSNAWNGLKQGLIVGLATGIILSALRGAVQGEAPPELFPLLMAGIEVPKSPPIMQVFVFSMATALIAGIAGGWFGGQLLPPIFGPPRRKSYGPGSIT